MITNGRTTVDNTATMIADRCVFHSRLYIHNDDQTKDLFIGGPDVTVSNGLRIEKLQNLSFEFPPLTDLYAISDGTPHTVSWIRIEVE